jgi:hypothetical protein
MDQTNLFILITIFLTAAFASAQCAAVTAPYTQDFATGALPNCWDENQITGSGWVFSGNPGYAAGTNSRPST